MSEKTESSSNPTRKPVGQSSSTVSSPEAQHLIAYVHNLSPVKRNKKNTIDYTTLVLQTDAREKQPALCYSKSKRKILDEHETKRAPIKITRFTKSADKTKIVINDKTLLTKPDEMDCTFQYSDDADEPETPLSDLLDEDSSKEDNITVCAKVVKVSVPKNVVSNGNKVSEVTLMDNTGTMMLDLWNEQIPQVQLGSVYRFTSLSTSYWNNCKKLTPTMNTAIKQTITPDLSNLEFKESDAKDQRKEHTIKVPQISTCEEIKRYKTRCNCNKRIMQLESTSTIVQCSYCSHSMRTSNCITKLFVNIIAEVGDQKKTLTMFDDTLKSALGEFDIRSIDTEQIEEKLLFLQNITMTYNERNVVTKLVAGTS